MVKRGRGFSPYPTPRKMRRRHSSVGSLASAATVASAAAGGVARALFRSGQLGSASSTNAAVATEHGQSRTLYKKKRRSIKAKKRARKYVKFSKAVSKVVNEKVYQGRSLIFNTLGRVATTEGQQKWHTVSLNAYNGATATPPNNSHDDISEIFVAETLTVGSDAIYLKSSRLDLTLKCPNTTETAIVNVYEMMFKKIPVDHNAANLLPEDIMASILTDDNAQSGANVGTVVKEDVGYTPFVSSAVTKHMTVTNHTRFILSGGQHVTYTIKDNLKKKVTLNDVQSKSMQPHFTKIIFIGVSGRDNADVTDPATLVKYYPAVSLNVSGTKTYWYQRLFGNLGKTGEIIA